MFAYRLGKVGNWYKATAIYVGPVLVSTVTVRFTACFSATPTITLKHCQNIS